MISMGVYRQRCGKGEGRCVCVCLQVFKRRIGRRGNFLCYSCVKMDDQAELIEAPGER